jgi:hypothetical protein
VPVQKHRTDLSRADLGITRKDPSCSHVPRRVRHRGPEAGGPRVRPLTWSNTGAVLNPEVPDFSRWWSTRPRVGTFSKGHMFWGGQVAPCPCLKARQMDSTIAIKTRSDAERQVDPTLLLGRFQTSTGRPIPRKGMREESQIFRPELTVSPRLRTG